MESEGHRIVHRGPPASGVKVVDEYSRRNLYLDGETLQSSMLLADPARLDLEYGQAMMCGLLLRPAPEKVLLVGLGGGSLVKFLLRHCPDAEIEVAEINREVIEVARRFFHLPEDSRLRILHAPGEEVVAGRLAAGRRYDLILLDAFDESGPARALLEANFLESCRDLLTPDGVFAMNLWNRPQDDFAATYDLLASLYRKRVLKLAVTLANTNVIVFGLARSIRTRELMGLKPAARSLGLRTGINFVRLLRQLYWQNS
ncbi:MAG: polyamine aminopropyltransferase [Desulfobulbaceae bacterium]